MGRGPRSPRHRCVPKNGETPARPPLSAGWQSLPFAQLQVLVSLSVQSSFHLSLAVLVCYRSPTAYLALGGVYHPHSGCTLKQPDSATAARCWSTSASHPPLGVRPYGFITLFEAPFRATWDAETALDLGRVVRPQFPTTGFVPAPAEAETGGRPGLQAWAFSCSLAVTGEITVVFFSSAY